MTDKEKEVYMRYCKYDKEPKEVIMNLVSVIEKQQAEIEDWKTDYNHRCQLAIDRKIELEKKDKIINEMAKELYKRGFDIDICDNCSEYNDDCKYIYDCIKQYFERKIEQ